MTRSRGAALAATIAFFGLSAAAGWSAGGADGSRSQATSTPCDDKPKNHTILVGSDRVDCKEPRASKSKANKITWRSPSGENIEVVFKSKDGIVPFPDLKCPGNSGTCHSGKIAAGASGRYEYEVWLYTASGKKLIDPVVVIDP